MVRSFDKLQRVDLGFAPNGIVRVFIAFPKGYDLKPEARLQLFERLQQRLATIPGVRGVSFGQNSLADRLFSGGESAANVRWHLSGDSMEVVSAPISRKPPA